MECNITMYEAVRRASLEVSKNTAVYYQGTKISFKKFIKLVDRMADILKYRLGIEAGDTVLLAEPNIPHVLILFYALNKLGAVVNLVHPFIPYNQTKNIFEKTHSKYAFLFEQRVAKEVESYRHFADYVYVCRVEDFLPPLKRFIYHTFMNKAIRKKLGKYHGSFPGFKYVYKLKPTHKPVEAHQNNSNEVAVMLHSGSTTGKPKTICLSNDSFNFIGYHAYEFLATSKENAVGTMMLSVLPSFHGFGLCMTMHAPLMSCFGSALVPKFSSKAVIDVMNHTKLGSMCGIPGVYEKLLADPKFLNNKNLKYLHVGFCGGDSMNVSLKERWDKAMKEHGSHCQVFEGYGLSEAIAVNCVNTYDHNKLGSIGYPGSGFSFKIIDEDEKEVKRGDLGEICVKSQATMLHYFEDEEATKATFTKDGYLKTGDIGYMDEDDFIFFKQRKKRVVKVSGVGVFPSEIENLVETVPGVISVCAIR
ncbi:MAG: acyl--CoA ligase, partial [Bacilli bacterium]|nr:acyl--CoA ligase [Bacilli bacterium]